MSNRLCIDTVHVCFLRKEPDQSRDLFGVMVGDDYESHSVLDFSKEEQVPTSLEGLIRYINQEDYSRITDLIAEHATAQKGVYFDGEYIDAPELSRILWELSQEAEGDEPE